MRDDLIIDCFAGGGGASVGIEMALGRQVDIAINHDPDAILMHKTKNNILSKKCRKEDGKRCGYKVVTVDDG